MPNTVYPTIYFILSHTYHGRGGDQARDIFIPQLINHYVRRRPIAFVDTPVDSKAKKEIKY